MTPVVRPAATSPGRTEVRASRLFVALVASLTALCAVPALLMAALAVAMLGDWPGIEIAVTLLAGLCLWMTVVLCGATVVAARCRVTIADDVVAVVRVAPRRRRLPSFERVRIPLDTIAAVAEAEQLLSTLWAPQERLCAWLLTHDGRSHVIAGTRGAGWGSLPVGRAAAEVALAAGVSVEPRPPGSFVMVGLFGGADLTEAGGRRSVEAHAEGDQPGDQERGGDHEGQQAEGEHAPHHPG